ncbi:MAG: NAD-dependent epimerase/dehydratase family protein [Sarcina sp.]
MKILVLGGTSFFGKNLVESLLEEKHQVTIGTRGITKDSFGDSVERIVMDRNDEESMKKAITENFDVIYDNLMYSSNNAKAVYEAIKGKTKRYIFISSVAVYKDGGYDLKEGAFDPYNYEVKFGDFRKEFDYAEGKQYGEAFLFKQKDFDAVAVRFPVVIGANDNTGRIQWYTDVIKNSKPFSVVGLDAKFVAISSKEAGEILVKLADSEIVGPVNITSNGVLTIGEVIKTIEEVTGGKANIVPAAEGVESSFYDKYSKLTTDNSKISKVNYQFKNLQDVIKETVQELI